ncbi:MAG: hypothetical protein HRT68_04185 [Flavobacteriaceae bacterium]|nr:hypothetical protein [Flavobacteriaceae bacterium]
MKISNNRLCIMIGVFIIFVSCFEQKPYKEPEIVELPKEAFMIDNRGKEMWFHVKSVNLHRNSALIAIYNEDGYLLDRGRFVLLCYLGENQDHEFIGDLEKQIDYYDGYVIHFKKTNCHLKILRLSNNEKDTL